MSNINLSTQGLPQTVLAAESAEAVAALETAINKPEGERREAIAQVVAQWPTFLDAWARLGQHGRDRIERYAAYRVGYHRGLDKLRQSGWRGSGYVRWEQETNRGFLRALHGLSKEAHEIRETVEAERCQTFLAQLDPTLADADTKIFE